MLVTFTCKAYGDITMFGDDAAHMLKLMGHSGTIPSAIFAKDVPAVLERLKNAIESEEATPTHDPSDGEGGIASETAIEDASVDNDDNDAEASISTSVRAFPLLEMLSAAIEADCNVMWREN